MSAEIEGGGQAPPVRQASAEVKQAEAAVLRAQAELKHAESQYERLARMSTRISNLPGPVEEDLEGAAGQRRVF
jgi:outer membrane protein TolC